MSYSPRTTGGKVRAALLFIFFLSIGMYAHAKTRDLVSGIRIEVNSVADGDIFTDPLILLEGQARHANRITVNGRPIMVDVEGRFTEPLLLTTGSSLLTIEAEDTFGKMTEKTITVAYAPETKAERNTLLTEPDTESAEAADVPLSEETPTEDSSPPSDDQQDQTEPEDAGF